MNPSQVSHADKAGWLRFIERLGVYLLVGPAAASLTILLLGFLFAGPSRDAPVFGVSDALLLVMVMYLVALPIAGLYALFVTLGLAKSRRLAFRHVVLSAFLVSLGLYFPALVLSAPSEGEAPGDHYWWMFAFVFLPVLAAGSACWWIAPALHRNDG